MAGPVRKDGSYDAGDADYEKKFGGDAARQLKSREDGAVDDDSKNNNDVKTQEQTSRGGWKTSISRTRRNKPTTLKTRIRDKIHNKSAFAFVVVILVGGVFYSSLFAPNILLVNMKDLLTNDLADATTALAAYTPKMIGYKIGKADCGDQESINCKLSTMSRAQVKAMEKHGFTVIGQKLKEDNLDDMDKGNDQPESRYQVAAVIFPNGIPAIDEFSYALLAGSSEKMQFLANGVWNPRSSYFMDARYKQRIKDKFDLTKSPAVYGQNESQVDQSFDQAMKGSSEQLDLAGQGAYSLGTLGTTGLVSLGMTAAAIAANPINTNNYLGVQCALYTQEKVAYNAAKHAKEVSLARFAMIYLQAADQIKSGLSDEVTMNVLASKLASGMDGSYGGKNATDTSAYRHIVLRELPIPSIEGLLFYNNAFDSIAALLPATAQVLASSQGVGKLAGQPNGLLPPPADLAGQSRQYCLTGETKVSKEALKPHTCPALTLASMPALSGALQQVAEQSRHQCPRPVDQLLEGQHYADGQWTMMPPAMATGAIVMPYIAGILDAGLAVWANAQSLLFTHATKGVAAGDALFAGTGVILGDMAMSRGMQPANIATLMPYLATKEKYQKQFDAQDKYLAKMKPFDIYNKFSFAGTLIRSFNFGAGANLQTGLGTISSLFGMIAALPSSLTSTASAIYNLQPDALNPIRLAMCPDPEYLAIGITADMGCNVRYSMGPIELNAQPKTVLDYMEKSHSDFTQKNIQELQARVAAADQEVSQADITRQLTAAQNVANQPMIDKKTGKAIPGSEYDKFLTYCVNREDPWGRTGLAVTRTGLSDAEKKDRIEGKATDGTQLKDTGQGDPYETRITQMYMAVTEGASADQDWYTGKKCLEQSEELQNFRAYTMMCSVDGSFAGAVDCTEKDNADIYTDDFYTSNNILYTSYL